MAPRTWASRRTWHSATPSTFASAAIAEAEFDMHVASRVFSLDALENLDASSQCCSSN